VLDQRVAGFPSTAAEAGKDAFSVDEAVAGRFSAASDEPHAAAAARPAGPGAASATTTNRAERAAGQALLDSPRGGTGCMRISFAWVGERGPSEHARYFTS
jgi:hypothetical protein